MLANVKFAWTPGPYVLHCMTLHSTIWMSAMIGLTRTGFEPSAVPRQVGCSEIVGRIVEDLKDESEPYRRMVMETIDKACPRSKAHFTAIHCRA